MHAHPPRTTEATPQGAHSAAAAFDFWRTAHAAVRGRARLVFLLTAAGAAAGAGLGMFAGQRLYTATGLVRLASSLPAVLRETDQNRPMAMFDGFIQAQAQVMGGREVVDAALKDPAWQKVNVAGANTPELFASCLKVETRPRSDFLQVKFTNRDPRVAAAGVQSVINAYKGIFTRDQDRSETSRLDVLQQRRAALASQAKALQARIDATSHGRTLTEIEPLCTEASDRLRKLRAALTDIQIAIEGGVGLTAVRLDSPGQGVEKDEVRRWCTDHISKLQCQLIEAKAEGMLETHPVVMRLRESIRGYQEQLASLPTGPEQNADPSVRAAATKPLQEREASLRKMVQTAQSDLAQLAAEREQLKTMDEHSNSLQQQLADTEARLDALTTESTSGGRLTIVSGGERPMTAVLDNRVKFAAAGAFAGACFPFGVLMLGTLLRRRLRTGEELAEDLAGMVPFVTVVPRIDGTPESISLAARCIHAARSRLFTGGAGSRVYLVSGPGRGEGKSGVAMGMALSLAAAGVRTLLVDADFGSRRLSTGLGAAEADGLFEAAVGGREPALHHLRAGPWVLTAGRATARDASRLRSEALRDLFARVRTRFDAVIIDADSIASGVTAPLIAPHTDGIVLTVGAGARQKEVHQAARQARQLGCPLAGAVFNRADVSQFPEHLRGESGRTGARELPRAALAFGPLVGAVLESLSLTREDDLRLAISGVGLAGRATASEEEMHEAQRRKQDRSAA